ncbi:MAG TPA: GGDEF domain-containing protein, partial [Planctomycetaceae bacterium]
MNLPAALGLWLANAAVAASLGYWLGRVMTRASAAPPLPAEGDDPAEVLDDLDADTIRADEDLAGALGDLARTASPAEDHVRVRVERLLRSSRTFERRLSRGHARLSRLVAAAGDAWLSLTDEVLRHRNRVGDFCRFLEEELAGLSPSTRPRDELLAAIRTLQERNRRLRRQLDEAKSRIARREASLAAAERDARVDPLTRLPNRRAFNERIAACQSRAERGVEPYALVLFDVDRFKDLNDARGHQFGDAVLAVFGRILNETLRTSDHAARYGG